MEITALRRDPAEAGDLFMLEDSSPLTFYAYGSGYGDEVNNTYYPQRSRPRISGLPYVSSQPTPGVGKEGKDNPETRDRVYWG